MAAAAAVTRSTGRRARPASTHPPANASASPKPEVTARICRNEVSVSCMVVSRSPTITAPISQRTPSGSVTITGKWTARTSSPFQVVVTYSGSSLGLARSWISGSSGAYSERRATWPWGSVIWMSNPREANDPRFGAICSKLTSPENGHRASCRFSDGANILGGADEPVIDVLHQAIAGERVDRNAERQQHQDQQHRVPGREPHSGRRGQAVSAFTAIRPLARVRRSRRRARSG